MLLVWKLCTYKSLFFSPPLTLYLFYLRPSFILFFSPVFSFSPPFWRELYKDPVNVWGYTAPMIDERMNIEYLELASGRGNRKCWENSLSHCQIDSHKFHIDRPGTEPTPPLWGTEDLRPEICHSPLFFSFLFFYFSLLRFFSFSFHSFPSCPLLFSFLLFASLLFPILPFLSTFVFFFSILCSSLRFFSFSFPSFPSCLLFFSFLSSSLPLSPLLSFLLLFSSFQITLPIYQFTIVDHGSDK